MTYQEQLQAQQTAQALLGLIGVGLQVHQAHQQQQQVNAYNQAVIQQQQAGARILNSIADQSGQRR